MNEASKVKRDKYLIIKHGALGDILQGLDAFESLRTSFPSANLTLLTSPAFVSLANLMPYFDSIIIDERKPFYYFRKTYQIRNYFRKNWTAVIDLQCSKRTEAYFDWFYKRGGGNWYGTAKECSHPMPNFTNVNNRDRMLEAVKMAGASEFNAELSWLVKDSKKVFQKFKIKKPYCVIIPGSSPHKPTKRWSAEKYANLSNSLYELGITSYLAGTKIERNIAMEVCTYSRASEILIDKTSLKELAQIFANAQFIVGNDTGPTFLAARTGAPTLMIMGADTNPYKSSPTGSAAGFIYNADIQAITTQEVLNKVRELGGLSHLK